LKFCFLFVNCTAPISPLKPVLDNFVQFLPVYSLFLDGVSYYDDAYSVILAVWKHYSSKENCPFLTNL